MTDLNTELTTEQSERMLCLHDNLKMHYAGVVIKRMLAQKGFPDSVIAGGFVRDLVTGTPAKDVDIHVFNIPEDEERGEFAARFDALIADFRTLGTLHSDWYWQEYLIRDHVLAVLKIDGIDIVFYNRDIKDIKEVTDTFDCNVNQYMIQDNGIPVFTGEVHPSEGFITLRNDIRPSRIKRMQDIQAKGGFVV